jgi:tRNA-i(6)A37 thiotransferase enzyme MiaB
LKRNRKKDDAHWSGRNPQSTVAVFPKEHYKPGDFVLVQVEDCTGATLIGKAIGYSENN